MIEFLVGVWTTRWIWAGILGFGWFISWLTKEEPKGEENE